MVGRMTLIIFLALNLCVAVFMYVDDEEDYKQTTYYGANMATDWYTKLEITFENACQQK